jgi:hypothetical protein
MPFFDFLNLFNPVHWYQRFTEQNTVPQPLPEPPVAEVDESADPTDHEDEEDAE